MKLAGYKNIRGTIRCETGLHIGGSKETMEIGGMDNPVIKHPHTNEPYIPGSSLKGKMRSELEKKRGLVDSKGEPHSCGECPICKTFGAHKPYHKQQGPTRIIVRDATLSEETKKKYRELLAEKPVTFLETKTETAINRRSNTAKDPRPVERVPAGTEFDFEITVQLFEEDNEKEILELIKQGLSLVQQSFLGGGGSRGSGKVTFRNLTLDGEKFDL